MFNAYKSTLFARLGLATGLFLLICPAIYAQTFLTGKITDENNSPIIGAMVWWEDSFAVRTLTDEAGNFSIARISTQDTQHLRVEFYGYQPMIIPVLPEEDNLLIAVSGIDLEAVNVQGRQRGSYISTLSPRNVEIVGEGELRRAPCCNLSESFETNATVDVNFTDAVTGAKEIEMLGLRGIYTQLMIENRPTFNGLATAYGLEYLPGTWLESIQISKGASTVMNGPRSVTGQINVELVKPFKAPPLFVNLFFNHQSRSEANIQLAHKFSRKLATNLLLHGNYFWKELDHNHDGFMDNPLRRQLNAMSRWSYESKTIESQFSVQGIIDERQGGQMAEGHHEQGSGPLYRIGIDTRRAEAVFKMGYLGFAQPYRSLGFQSSATWHDMGARFGSESAATALYNRQYQGTQQSFYTNLIYETILFNTFHKIRTGASYQYDNYRETFADVRYARTEHAPGAFAEYTYDYFSRPDEEVAKFTLIAAFRVDYLNGVGFLPVPRLNLKYNFSEKSVLRASAGRGWRTSNFLAENFAYLPGSRQFVVQEALRPEVAWNYGLNFTQKFMLGAQEGTFSFDLYRTDFENQVVVDIDATPDEVRLYNLDGQSFANTIIVMWTQDLLKNLELKLAYKFNDVRTTYSGELLAKPLLPMHRGLATIFYVTPNEAWEFSATAQLVGAQRMPSVLGASTGLPQYRIDRRSPVYPLFNAQVTWRLKNGIDLYLGAENLGNYRQTDPIIGAGDPFSTDPSQPRFDATSVFGPIMGTMGYAGLRYTLKSWVPQKEIRIFTSAKCEMCKDIIEGAVLKLKGVEFADQCLTEHLLTVRYNPKKVSTDQLRACIAALGYQADGVPRNEAAYEKLSGCCK